MKKCQYSVSEDENNESILNFVVVLFVKESGNGKGSADMAWNFWLRAMRVSINVVEMNVKIMLILHIIRI